MDLEAVMDEIAEKLKVLPGVIPQQVHPHPVGFIHSPAVVVSYPERIEFDQTYGRGEDRFVDLPVTLLNSLGQAYGSPLVRRQFAGWTAGSGVGSVKEVLEGATWTSCDGVSVTGCRFAVEKIDTVEYLAAIFLVDVVGPGTE